VKTLTTFLIVMLLCALACDYVANHSYAALALGTLFGVGGLALNAVRSC
jgi:hypothetical protein